MVSIDRSDLLFYRVEFFHIFIRPSSFSDRKAASAALRDHLTRFYLSESRMAL